MEFTLLLKLHYIFKPDLHFAELNFRTRISCFIVNIVPLQLLEKAGGFISGRLGHLKPDISWNASERKILEPIISPEDSGVR